MDAHEVKQLLEHLAAGVGQRAIAVRCQCENLETVYVMTDEDGNVVVTDDHMTFQYLYLGTDASYVPVETLDMAAARRLIEELGVQLKPAPPDGFPSIECKVRPGVPIKRVVGQVSMAVDRIFESAMRPDLK